LGEKDFNFKALLFKVGKNPLNRIQSYDREADESAFWLELLAESGLVPGKRLASEADQLTAIIVASRKTIGRQHKNF
jgi:hypothetical protein